MMQINWQASLLTIPPASFVAGEREKSRHAPRILPLAPHSNAHQFRFGQLRHARQPLVQFGGLIRPNVGVDHLADFGRFAGVIWPVATAFVTPAMRSAASRALVIVGILAAMPLSVQTVTPCCLPAAPMMSALSPRLSPRCWRQTRTRTCSKSSKRFGIALQQPIWSHHRGVRDRARYDGDAGGGCKAGVTSAENRAALAGKR
jgi:hypothetical protein